jgi:micrococcal nuclease
VRRVRSDVVGRALTVVASASLAVVATGCDRDAAEQGHGNATVSHIVDGDTIDVIVDGRTERVRLTGIDTPEIAHEAFADRPASTAECFGDEATAFITSLVPVGSTVRLERDVVGRDDYGRILAYVYRASDGVFVNYELIRHGYARPLSIAPNTAYRDLMVQAARDAERDDAGLWSACR